MMCCAYSQLVRPGAPFVLGNFLSSMSLKSGAPTFGMPEPVSIITNRLSSGFIADEHTDTSGCRSKIPRLLG